MEWVEVQCQLCNRHGRYRAERFYEIAGTTNGPDALARFAAEMGCERAIEQIRQRALGMVVMDDRCRIRYHRPE